MTKTNERFSQVHCNHSLQFEKWIHVVYSHILIDSITASNSSLSFDYKIANDEEISKIDPKIELRPKQNSDETKYMMIIIITKMIN